MSNKEKFWMLLDRDPFASECWDRAESSADLDRVKARMWSRQERVPLAKWIVNPCWT